MRKHSLSMGFIILIVGVIVLWMIATFSGCKAPSEVIGTQTSIVIWDADADSVSLQYFDNEWRDVFTIKNKVGRNEKVIDYKIGLYRLKAMLDNTVGFSENQYLK